MLSIFLYLYLFFSCLISALPPHMALLSIQATSPERRFTQKEIIAGEERPKYLLIKQHQDSVSSGSNATSAGIYYVHLQNIFFFSFGSLFLWHLHFFFLPLLSIETWASIHFDTWKRKMLKAPTKWVARRTMILQI